MRPVLCVSLVLATSACFASSKVTLILDLETQQPGRALSEMKTELQRLMRDSGVELDWRRLDELSASDSFARLVIVKFNGTCELPSAAPPLPVEPAALAFSHVADGHVIPFAEVECDRIRSSLASVRAGSSGGEMLVGRAIGRVLAHELHHILEGTRTHTKHGLTRKSLSPQDLISDRVRAVLDPAGSLSRTSLLLR